MKLYRYYCRMRPPMPGAIPRDGLDRVYSFDTRKSINGVDAWGFVEYTRELTEKEIVDYELVACKGNPFIYNM